MINLGYFLAGLIGVGMSLYLLWNILEAINRYIFRRRAKASGRTGQHSICHWYVNSDGELMHARVKPSSNPL